MGLRLIEVQYANARNIYRLVLQNLYFVWVGFSCLHKSNNIISTGILNQLFCSLWLRVSRHFTQLPVPNNKSATGNFGFPSDPKSVKEWSEIARDGSLPKIVYVGKPSESGLKLVFLILKLYLKAFIFESQTCLYLVCY